MRNTVRKIPVCWKVELSEKLLEEIILTKAVIFDMYETLITLFESPLYFGTQIAADAGIDEDQFQEIWKKAESDRTIGKVTLEEILENIFKINNCYSDEKLELIVNKRIQSKEEAFNHLNEEIIPMLTELKKRGILVGLISNCFSEEAVVIKKSKLYPFFDAVCLSFDEGLQKPDPAIFYKCIEKLCVKPSECIYIGDGGSNELETATKIGMKAIQAAWYLKSGTCQPSKRKFEFEQLKNPYDLFCHIN